MNRQEAIAKGFRYHCLNCQTAFKTIPTEPYEDGHGGRRIEACGRCGCDLLADLNDDSPITKV